MPWQYCNSAAFAAVYARQAGHKVVSSTFLLMIFVAVKDDKKKKGEKDEKEKPSKLAVLQ